MVIFVVGVVLAILLPGLESKGIPAVDNSARNAGLTFCAVAAVQILSYPFHDPVLVQETAVMTTGNETTKHHSINAHSAPSGRTIGPTTSITPEQAARRESSTA